MVTYPNKIIFFKDCQKQRDSFFFLTFFLQVNPLSGPIEGKTVLAVIGQDIGRRFEDVLEVSVGGQPCNLTGLDSEYRTGRRYGTLAKMLYLLTDSFFKSLSKILLIFVEAYS